MNTYVITIDGTSGSGKGTLALKIANALGFHLLDSGAIYRLAALKVINTKVDMTNEDAVVDVIKDMQIHFEKGDELTLPFLDGVEVSQQIRSEETASAASIIAAYPSVRELLFDTQRGFLKAPGLVADGRDMGTTIFPEAKIKIFLAASAEIRAKRRYNQLNSMGLSANIAALLSEIEERDERDRTRSVSPLVPATDAVVVDSSMLDLDQVFKLVMSHIEDVNNNLV